jgi:transposase
VPRSAPPLPLTETDHRQIEEWLSAFGTPQQVVQRSRIVLGAAAGHTDTAIAKALDVNRKTVTLWRMRFLESGLSSLWEVAPGRGRKPTYTAKTIQQIIDTTLHTTPPGMTHWSCRTLAAKVGISKSMINTVWQSHHLQPHRVETFKLSRDPRFLEKLTDVVGLYLNPPDKAIVLCVDEKSQIQALDRTQPGLPLKRGRCGTFTHDYKRNGTTTLFAALEMLQGKVVGQCYTRHRHQEFLKFLRHLDQEFPGERPLHLIIDNYGTHTHATVTAWLKRHPRFVVHFVPTSSSWLNLIERWFTELTSKRLRRGSFCSVKELQQAIAEFLAAWNADPKPFVWTATVESIVAKLSRCRQTLERIQPGSSRSRPVRSPK